MIVNISIIVIRITICLQHHTCYRHIIYNQNMMQNPHITLSKLIQTRNYTVKNDTKTDITPSKLIQTQYYTVKNDTKTSIALSKMMQKLTFHCQVWSNLLLSNMIQSPILNCQKINNTLHLAVKIDPSPNITLSK